MTGFPILTEHPSQHSDGQYTGFFDEWARSLRPRIIRRLRAAGTPPISSGDWICHCRLGRSSKARHCSQGKKISPQKRLCWNGCIASGCRRGCSCIQLTSCWTKFQRFCETFLQRQEKTYSAAPLYLYRCGSFPADEAKSGRKSSKSLMFMCPKAMLKYL